MKYIFLCIFILIASPVLADPCRIVETADKVEVVCEGKPGEYKPEPKGPDGLTQTERDSIQSEAKEAIDRIKKKVADLDLQIEDQKNKARENIQLNGFSVIELSRSYGYVTYSLKVDATNPGPRGLLHIKVIAKDKNGHQLHHLYLTGLVAQGKTRTLTDTTMVSYDLVPKLYLWDIDEVRRTEQ